ncbi:MAG: hypothetical protein HKM98_10405, partial [Gammaproteobacteria bacterium]|nr:hypothetical protein [Gammaproteobacteria bacterium]
MFRRIYSPVLLCAGLLISTMASATINPFNDDFEGYLDTNPDALAGSGWLVFANVFDGVSGNYLYGYGPFPAPNDGGGFSGVSVGEGGAEQGAQQLNTFSDYNNSTEHGNGNPVESLVFVEQTITTANVGQTWTFRFDAKLGNLEGATTAEAFLKTLDPNAGFAETNLVTQETTTTPVTWSTYELTLTIDAGLVGQVIQFGFSNTASNFEGSGVFYDNVDFFPDFSILEFSDDFESYIDTDP